ncbi:toll/interleukin-1 receptor domain-containing protein [Algoriphagus sp.]|uniref:toll/interleukin-1 receptor domain-containing protein n=1 Tax=Algoriphagus sp. TaxID=1872435 RepID=UPI0025D64711|nr:toll/interleukin-1 receptor domain-containing protein [Algoriphagus sp.]
MADNKIFVSYRRQDASGEAGRLVDHLREIYGEESVFLDVETLEAGLDFVQAIDKALNSCKVLIAMIGPHWINVKDAEGNSRLFHDGDFIRIEIAAALKRNIRVIPVLVNGAVMPSPEQLPEDLQALTRRHAQELSSSRWKYDCDQLVSVLDKIIEPIPKQKPEPFKPRPIPPKQKSWLAKNYLWIIGIFVGIIILISLLNSPENDSEFDPYQTSIEQEDQKSDPLVEDQTNTSTEELQNFRNSNPEGTEIYDNLSLSGSESNQPVIEEISGYWLLSDNQGNTSTLVFNQYNDEFEFIEYNVFNVEIGEGTGTISGNQLTASYYNSLVEINGNLRLSTSTNGQSWSGTVSFPSLGTSSNIALQRINP